MGYYLNFAMVMSEEANNKLEEEIKNNEELAQVVSVFNKIELKKNKCFLFTHIDYPSKFFENQLSEFLEKLDPIQNELYNLCFFGPEIDDIITETNLPCEDVPDKREIPTLFVDRVIRMNDDVHYFNINFENHQKEFDKIEDHFNN
jgi:hypothetical protein